MAFNMFLKLDNIDGESTVKGFEKWITVESYNFGAAAELGTSTDGRFVDKVTVREMQLSGPIQKSSPKLFEGCADGKHFDKAELVVTRSNARSGPLTFLRIRLGDVLISSYGDAGVSSSSHLPTDTFALNFLKIEYSYTAQSPTGAVGDTVSVTVPAVT